MLRLFRLICLAAACAWLPAAEGAVLFYVQDLRLVQSAGLTAVPAVLFTDFDQGISGGGTLESPDSAARQHSILGPEFVAMESTVTGMATRALSVLRVSFQLNDSADYQLDGRLQLTGGTGFSCISLVNLAQRDPVLVNEVLPAPGVESAVHAFARSGILAPGDYELEAIIYAGGEGRPEQGSLEMSFRIPEPGFVPLAGAGAWLLSGRRRQKFA